LQLWCWQPLPVYEYACGIHVSMLQWYVGKVYVWLFLWAYHGSFIISSLYGCCVYLRPDSCLCYVSSCNTHVCSLVPLVFHSA
jgi:hypothetical protein